MMTPMLAKLGLGYLVICIVVGLLGHNRKLGGWGYFFGSLVLTPIVGLLLLMASDPRPDDDDYPEHADQP